MKIAINAITANDRMRGVERYIVEMLRHLHIPGDENEYVVFYAPWQSYIKNLTLGDRFRLVEVSLPRNKVFRALWQIFMFTRVIRRYAPDLVHYPNTMPLFIKEYPTVVTIHDIFEYVSPGAYPLFQMAWRRIVVKYEAKIADIIITVSDTTKGALVRVLGIDENKICVVYNGISKDFIILEHEPPDSGKALGDYLLCVGVIDKIKSVDKLIRAYVELPQYLQNKYNLVIAGKPGNAFLAIKNLINKLKLNNNVLFYGHVSFDKLIKLYRGARAVIFPSIWEGFGFPIIEAMMAGVPVVTSNKGACPEIAGDAAIIIDPDNISVFAKAIESVIIDDNLRSDLIKRGKDNIKRFDWGISAAGIRRAYSEAFNKGVDH